MNPLLHFYYYGWFVVHLTHSEVAVQLETLSQTTVVYLRQAGSVLLQVCEVTFVFLQVSVHTKMMGQVRFSARFRQNILFLCLHFDRAGPL